jgi:HEAT repeat protein
VLHRIGAPAVPTLAAALQNRSVSSDVRKEYTMTLQLIGPQAKEVVPTLAEAPQAQDSSDVRRSAAEVLARLPFALTE